MPDSPSCRYRLRDRFNQVKRDIHRQVFIIQARNDERPLAAVRLHRARIFAASTMKIAVRHREFT